MDKVTITNLDQLTLRTDYKNNLIAILLIAIFLFAVFIIGITMLNEIEENLRTETGEKLEVSLTSANERLDLWFEQKLMDLSILASNKETKNLVRSLNKIERNPEMIKNSKELEIFRENTSSWLDKRDDLGIDIISTDSINIASTRDEFIGKKNFLFKDRSEYMNMAFSGNVIIVPPIESEIPIPDHSGVISPGLKTMFLAAPINDNGKIISLLVLRINLSSMLTKIAQSSHFSESGEIYFIDDEGRLLSKSRFESLLSDAGLITRGAITRSTFEIRNPGIDLNENKIQDTPRYLQEFTLLASEIMNKNSGKNLEGYFGYRGNRVLGVWRWVSKLQIGIASEIEADEALALYTQSKTFLFIGLCITIVFALSLLYGMFWVRRKSVSALQEINEKLENTISERTRELAAANAHLIDSWERFRKLTYYSHDLNVIISITGEIKFENSAVEKILGIREGERIGKPYLSFVHSDDVHSLKNTLSELLENPNEIVSSEYRFRRKDENYVVLESYLQNFLDDPNIEGIIINSRDVTDRRIIEEMVKKSEQRFRSIWENSKDGMRITDQDGMILMVNNMYCHLTKKEPHEMIGELFSVIYREDLQTDILDIYSRKFEDGEILGQLEEEVHLWDDTLVWFSVSNSYIYLDNGSKVLLSIVRNITETKKSELIKQLVYKINNTLFVSENFDHLLKNVHEIFSEFMNADNFFIATYSKGNDTISIPYVVDENGIVKEIPVKKTFTGYVIQKGEPVLLRESDSKKMIESGEVNLLGKLSKVWIGVPIFIQGEPKAVMVVQDYKNEKALSETDLEIMKFVSDQIGLVMERLINREALINSENNLREVIKTKDRFFSILAHDLKNPFATIIGFADILNEDYNDMNDKERLNLLREIRLSAQNTYGLLENLLDWSRTETGSFQLNPGYFYLKEINENVFSVVDGNAKIKNIDLRWVINDEIKVFADKSAIETVLRNLITNSIKFTNPGGFVEVSCLETKEYCEITVKDNGIGIPKENLEKLFDLKDSYSTRGTANETGSGLGLILCRELIERNGGKLRVESGIGKGSSFIFTLTKN